jgi:hypothetical protein
MTATAGEASTPNQHLDGRPVSSSTYSNHGCRCDGCRSAWRVRHVAYMHAHPEQQVKQRERQRKGAVSTRRIFPPDVVAVRTTEYMARYNRAAGRARQQLAARYHDEFVGLRTVALAEINAERGPLPGDEVA